jgi:hypothetical protein
MTTFRSNLARESASVASLPSRARPGPDHHGAARTRRPTIGSVVVAALACLLVACSDSDSDPIGPDPTFCGPAPTADVPSPPAQPAAVAVALDDAADRVLPALGTTPTFVALEDAFLELAGEIRAGRLEAACILVDETWTSVGQLQIDAAGEADLAAIVLALKEAMALPLPREGS